MMVIYFDREKRPPREVKHSHPFYGSFYYLPTHSLEPITTVIYHSFRMLHGYEFLTFEKVMDDSMKLNKTRDYISGLRGSFHLLLQFFHVFC